MIPPLLSALSPSGPSALPFASSSPRLDPNRPPQSRAPPSPHQAKNGELRRQLRRTESTAAAGFVKDVVLKFLLAGDEARPRCTGHAREMHGRCTGDAWAMHGRCTGDAYTSKTHLVLSTVYTACACGVHVLCMCTDYARQAHKTHFELLASVLQFSPREIAQVHAACTPPAHCRCTRA